MGLAKLDMYNYTILQRLHDASEYIIRISVNRTNDPDIVDIMSEIHRYDGKIHIDGRYYSYLDNYELYTTDTGVYIDLNVVDIT